jgi:hypothetical protein
MVSLVERQEATAPETVRPVAPKRTQRLGWFFQTPCAGVKYFAFKPEPIPPDDWDFWPGDETAGVTE